MIRFGCPACKTVLQAQMTQGGKVSSCPKCKQKVRVPYPVAVRVPANSPVQDPVQDDIPPTRPAPPELPASSAVLPVAQVLSVKEATQGFELAHGIVLEEDSLDVTGFLAPPQQPDEIGRLGPYRVLSVLGAGGMGVVFKAEDPHLERTVALKVMLPSLSGSPVSAKRFEREAKLAANIKHNHIVTIHNVGSDRGIPYVTMEFLEGESLDTRLKRDKSLPLAEVLRIGRQVAEGLAAAHAKDMIHRDIKPANIWLEGPDAHVKILDFGLARSVGDQTGLTQLGAILGTPAFMAPEQFGGVSVDQRADLFSLGCVLYAMVTGELPFKGNDTTAVLHSIVLDVPKVPLRARTDVPAALSDLIMRLLAKKAEDRPSSAQQVAETLRAISEGKLRTSAIISMSQVRPALQKVDSWMEVLGRSLETGVAFALRHLRLAPYMDRAAPEGTSRRRPIFIGLATLVIAVVVLLPVYFLRGRDGGPQAVGDIPPVTPPTSPGETKEPDLRMVIQLGHADVLTAAAVSSDGKWLATASKDSTAKLWEVASGKEVRTFKGHTGSLTSVAFSHAGTLLATGSTDGTARLWQVVTGKEVQTFRVPTSGDGRIDGVTCLVLAGDGSWLIAGSTDRKIRKWDRSSAEVTMEFRGHTGPVTSAALSGDGKWLATGSADKTARVWDVGSGKERRASFTHGDAVKAVSLSHDGRWLATGCNDHRARLWDAQTGLEARRFPPQNSDVRSVALTGDGKWLVSSGDNTRVWEATADREKPQRTLQGQVSSVFLSGDGKWLVTCGSFDRTAHLKDFEQVIQPKDIVKKTPDIRSFRGDAAMVQSLAVSADARWLASCCEGSVRLWKLPAGKEARSFADSPARCVAFAGDGKSLLIGRNDSVRLRDLADQEFKDVRTFAGNTLALALSGNGSLLLTANADKTARLWEVSSGKELHSLKDKHSEHVTCVALSADGKWAATGSLDKAVYLWDVASGKDRLGIDTREPVQAIVLSGDGTLLVTAGADKAARVWDAQSGKELRAFTRHTAAITSLALSADGKHAVSGSSDGTARLWEIDTAREVRPFRGHAGAVTSVAMSQDGKWLFTASQDCTTKVWDLAAGKELCSLVSFRKDTWAVFDAAGRYDSFNQGHAPNGVHWVDGPEILSLDTQIRQRFHDHGLLAKYLGFNHERLLNLE